MIYLFKKTMTLTWAMMLCALAVCIAVVLAPFMLVFLIVDSIRNTDDKVDDDDIWG